MLSGQEAALDPAHLDYLRAHAPVEDPFLRQLRIEAREAGLPAIQIAWEQAFFLQILLRAAGARRVIEVGTLGGYSAIAMAMALPEENGRVDSIEIDPARAAFAADQVARSAARDRVRIHRGAALEILPGFADASADAAFLDADKANYPAYLREALRIVRTGGLILADNAFAFGQLFAERPTEAGVEEVRAFNDLVPDVVGLRAMILPLGDGMWCGIKEN